MRISDQYAASLLSCSEGTCIASLLVGLFRTLRPVLWNGAKSMGKEKLKALGREALRTGGKILTDNPENPQTETKDIISKHVTDSTQSIKSYAEAVASEREHRQPREMRNVRKQRLNAPCLAVV